MPESCHRCAQLAGELCLACAILEDLLSPPGVSMRVQHSFVGGVYSAVIFDANGCFHTAVESRSFQELMEVVALVISE